MVKPTSHSLPPVKQCLNVENNIFNAWRLSKVEFALWQIVRCGYHALSAHMLTCICVTKI